MNRLSLLLLGLLAVALSGIILWQLDPAAEEDSALPQAAPRRAPATASIAGPIAARGGRNAEWSAAILARPLFSPDRRPPAPGAAAARPADAPLPRLTGTLVTAAGRSAIFAGSATPLVVGEGAQVGGYTIRRIEPGQVTLAGPEGPRTLVPSFDPNRPAAPAPSLGTPVPGRPPGGPVVPGMAGPGITGLTGPGLLPAGAAPGVLPAGPSPEGSGAAEGAVPFEQNATPSGLDILRNTSRTDPAPASGAPLTAVPGAAR